jgi:hypothetical protein
VGSEIVIVSGNLDIDSAECCEKLMADSPGSEAEEPNGRQLDLVGFAAAATRCVRPGDPIMNTKQCRFFCDESIIPVPISLDTPRFGIEFLSVSGVPGIGFAALSQPEQN